jgi:2-methylcitrate dehydratase PrpD
MDDGRIETIEIEVAKGHPGNPIDWNDMRLKFDGLVDGRIGDQAEHLFTALRDFGGAGSLGQVRDVVRALA